MCIVRPVVTALLAIGLLSSTAGSSIAQTGNTTGLDIGFLIRNPAPSPDASQIVFESNLDGPSRPMNLWIISASGGGLRKLTVNSSGDDEGAAWSPSGTSIAFASAHSGISDIWTIGIDGSNLLQLTAGSLTNRQPTWSPSTQKIAFVSDRGGTNDIWIMNPDGSGQTRLTSLPGQENHPSFSPDGSKIVFSETSGPSALLMIINADGSGLTQLTNGLFEDWNPRWSAAGIVFSSNRDSTASHSQPWIVQPDGSGLKKFSAAFTVDPAILKGSTIIFSDEFSGIQSASMASELSAADVNTGAKTQITSLKSYFSSADVNENGTVDCGDLDAVKLSFGKKYGQAGFNPRADTNEDGVIDIKDLSFVASNLPSGTVCH